MSRDFEPLTPNSKTHDLADWNSPDQILMQVEEIGDDEVVSLAGIQDIPREALAILLNWLVGEPTRNSSTRWRKTTLKIAAISHMLNVQGLRELSLEQLGKQLGTTRANLSLYTLAVCDSCGIDKSYTGKRRSARESYRLTARRSHEKRGHKMTNTPTNPPNA
jgi:hypothetical protein